MTTPATTSAPDPAGPAAGKKRKGVRIPGFAQLQRLGKSLMLPIALLPAAGILLRLGQDDMLGGTDIPVIGPFFDTMSAAGDALFANLAILFAVGVAIGFAKKADGSTALAAVAGYLVMAAVFENMSPVVLEGVEDAAGQNKAEAVHQLAEGGVSALWPATILQHHPHVSVLVDEAAAGRLQLANYYRQTYAAKPVWQGL
ncbi:hypothetical protein BJF89_05980 [Corynebacterium sp. CNJ-954]|nr:hypothetical protein BJF89_05980 [Corynebacterium sp. CNJ-954]